MAEMLPSLVVKWHIYRGNSLLMAKYPKHTQYLYLRQPFCSYSSQHLQLNAPGHAMGFVIGPLKRPYVLLCELNETIEWNWNGDVRMPLNSFSRVTKWPSAIQHQQKHSICPYASHFNHPFHSCTLDYGADAMVNTKQT
jgi:hypothetical protein